MSSGPPVSQPTSRCSPSPGVERKAAPSQPPSGHRQHIVDRVEIERHARRGQHLLLAIRRRLQVPVDEPHLAAGRLAAELMEIAAIEPVDDADQA